MTLAAKDFAEASQTGVDEALPPLTTSTSPRLLPATTQLDGARCLWHYRQAELGLERERKAVLQKLSLA